MKKIIPLLLFTLLISCSPESDSNPIPSPTPSLKLTKVVETYSSYSYTHNFIYSGDVLSRIETIESPGNNTSKTEYNYVNNKLQSESFYDNGVLSGTIAYSYTGELITSSLSNEGGIINTTNYTYNSSKQMINAKQYDNGNLVDNEDIEYNAQGNISKRSDVTASFYTTYEYDTNKNPYSLILNDAVMKIFDDEYCKNNATKRTDSYGSITTYEYVYNDNGYPTQKIEKRNGLISLITMFTYN